MHGIPPHKLVDLEVTLTVHRRCPRCGYDLYGLSGWETVRCPECGLESQLLRDPKHTPKAGPVATALGAVLLGATCLFFLFLIGAIGPAYVSEIASGRIDWNKDLGEAVSVGIWMVAAIAGVIIICVLALLWARTVLRRSGR